MTELAICTFPRDDVLRKKAKNIPGIDRQIQKLMDNMVETMVSAHGLGLAAPQVGVSLKLIIVQMPDEQPIILINPEIVERSGEQAVTEGCLSIPGYYGELVRSAEVAVKGRNQWGKRVKIKAEGLLAEALDHEIDHLNGVLYIDHIPTPDHIYKTEPASVPIDKSTDWTEDETSMHRDNEI